MTNRKDCPIRNENNICLCVGEFCSAVNDTVCQSVRQAYTWGVIQRKAQTQKPRVMMLEEVKQHNNQDGCVWFEQLTYNAVASFVIQDEEDTEIISPYILGEPINHGYWSNSNYNHIWRCWTSRPTDEQRATTPWEEI